jgi:hypothetical protein
LAILVNLDQFWSFFWSFITIEEYDTLKRQMVNGEKRQARWQGYGSPIAIPKCSIRFGHVSVKYFGIINLGWISIRVIDPFQAISGPTFGVIRFGRFSLKNSIYFG